VKKKLYLFDLDGVLISSLENMKISWKSSCNLCNVKVSFNKFYKNLGMGFFDSLRKLKIYKNQETFIKNYEKTSIKNFDKINIFKDVNKVLRRLKKKHKLGIVTSKDLNRTKKILKLHNIKVDIVSCPRKNLRSKPYPDQILFCIKKLKVNKNDTVFVGDTSYDYYAAKSAKINFVFANYGYGKYDKKYKNKIKNFNEILKYNFD